jgi:uncharacterized surface protein with fasciclin (FAS1) repeats
MSPMSTRFRSSRTLGVVVGVVAVASLSLAACSSDDSATSTTEKKTTTTEQSSTTTAAGSATDAMMKPSGPGCAAVPADGAGSFKGMAQDPAATAASNNPALSTLVSAVTAADLVDTLNGPGPFTIFAPANSAFEKIPADTLKSVLADKAQLTDILTYHVIAGEKLSSAQLEQKGSATSVEGKELTFTDDNGTLKVNGQTSAVCIDVPTANATVHIIDSVLMPPA